MLSILFLQACTGSVVVGDTGDEQGHRDPWQLDGDTSEVPEIAIDLVDPPTGSTAGGELARVLGGPLDKDGDSPVVTLGGAEGKVTDWTATAVEFITPPGAAGPAVVTLAQGEARASASGLFTYDDDCDGITRVDPDPVEGDWDRQGTLVVSIYGCATGIGIAEPTWGNGERDGVIEVESYPGSVEGQGEIEIWYARRADGGTWDWSIQFGSDQGLFLVNIRLES